MALIYNRARMATSTTGTGTITLGSAITGYATFAEAGVQDADVVSYAIEDGNDFEIGIGTYTASGTTLSRDTVTLSKISGTAGTSKISLSGSAQVFITARAEDFALYQPLDSDLTAIAALATTSFGRGLLTEADASSAFGTIKQDATEGATGVLDKATDAEIRAATSGAHAICAEDLASASAPVTLTDAATVAIDWTAGINFTLTLTTDRVLGNPTNEIPGTWRTVFVISDGGPDELTFGSEYGGTPPTLDDITTTKGYLLSIYCRTASQFLVFSADGSPA